MIMNKTLPNRFRNHIQEFMSHIEDKIFIKVHVILESNLCGNLVYNESLFHTKWKNTSINKDNFSLETVSSI